VVIYHSDSNSGESSSSGPFSSGLSIEEYNTTNNVFDLLYSNYILYLCILYFIIVLFIFFIFNDILRLNLRFIKKYIPNKLYNFLVKYTEHTYKFNKI